MMPPHDPEGGDGKATPGCPFCGRAPLQILRPGDAAATFYVAAMFCMCGGVSSTAYQMATGGSPSEAVEKVRELWGTRV